MRRWTLHLIIILTLLLQGCFGFATKSAMLTIELVGNLGTSHEVLLQHGTTSYLLSLGIDGKTEFRLTTGAWTIRAYARNGEEQVVAASKEVVVQGGRSALLRLELAASTGLTSPPAQEATHYWRDNNDLEIVWEYPEETSSAAEIWRRSKGTQHWVHLGSVESGVKSFWTSFERYDDVFAVRLLTIGAGDESFPSGLRLSGPGNFGLLELTYEFRHEFPLVTQSFASLDSGVGWDLAQPPPEEYHDLVAVFSSESAFAKREKLLAEHGLLIKDAIPLLLEVLVEPDPTSGKSLEEWSTLSTADFYLRPNWLIKLVATPSTTNFANWHLEYLRVPQAHTITKGNQQIRVAILDTGINPEAMPSTVRFVTGYNFTDQTTNTRDTLNTQGHGTKVAQALTNVSPYVTIQPVKVMADSGYGNTFNVQKGLLFAAGLPLESGGPVNSTPAQIINLSLGQTAPNQALAETVNLVARTGAVIIGAAGNSENGISVPGLYYPAAYPEVIAVGSLKPTNGREPSRAYYSHFGPDLDFSAPEASFLGFGTSFSAPLVSGVAALMLSNGFRPSEIRGLLAQTAIDLGLPGRDDEFGYGLVNAHWGVLGIQGFLVRVYSGDGSLVYEKTTPLQSSGLTIPLPLGEYIVEAWLNLEGSSTPRPGDYLYRSETIALEQPSEYVHHLSLEEVY